MKKYKDYIYLDYAATTPLDPTVEEVFLANLKTFGNPGSLHNLGQKAIAIVDKSRQTIADELNTDFHNIIFTGSATEANNLAIRGVVKKAVSKGIENPKIIISSIEHPSIKSTTKDLGSNIEIVEITPSKSGIIDLETIKNEIDENTVLVSIMYANNEIGAIQPIKEIANIIKNYREKNLYTYPLFHTDAVQAFQYLETDIEKLGIDMMTLSAHKIYGPKGTGLLAVKKNDSDSYLLEPIITGGGQEFGLRSGTENVASIASFAKAVELVSERREEETERIKNLTYCFYKNLKKINSKIELNGVSFENRDSEKPLETLPNIYNVYFPNKKSEELLIKFDIAGVGVSAGSACSARSVEASPIIKSLGYDNDRAGSSIRFSFGKEFNQEESAESLRRIENIIK
jgi:cysteine desulfurase